MISQLTVAFAIGTLLVSGALTFFLKSVSSIRTVGAVTALVNFVVVLLVPVASGNTFGNQHSFIDVDQVNRIPMLASSLLLFVTFLMAPDSALRSGFVWKSLVSIAAAQLAYTAGSPWLMSLGIAIAWLPFYKEFSPVTRITFALASVLLPIGLTLGDKGIWLVFAAIILRKGLFPAHGWITRTMGAGHWLTAMLVINTHIGAFVLLRTSHTSAVWLTDLALGTAVYAAALGMRDLSPRRTLGWLSISQSAFLLAGIGSQTSEGIAGSLLLWQVVVASTTILAGIMAALESRMSVSLTLKHSSGLAARFPRLAVGFIIAGLALVGAPMTLGFYGEDLLMHGTLAAHPRIGILLPIATAMNAITVFRMFSRLFLGPITEDLTDVPDALPRERLAITAVISFLILGGLVPGWLLPKTAATHDAVTTHPGN